MTSVGFRTRPVGDSRLRTGTTSMAQPSADISPERSGFDPRADIAGIILNRWGHAYVCPAPGFYFGRNGKPAAPDVLRQPVGRVAFANSELHGHQNWRDATAEGKRAVEQLR